MKISRFIAFITIFVCLVLCASGCSLTKKDYKPTDESYFVFTDCDGGYSISAKTGVELPEDIVLPKSYNGKNVVAVADKGFYRTQIKSIKIPDTVKHIGTVAFSSCPNLKRVVFLEGTQTIGDYSFYSCPQLSDVELPESLVSIGISAFQDTIVSDIDLRKNVESVGQNAFKSCKNLASVYIGSKVSVIGDGAFEGCNSSIKFVIADTNPNFVLIDNVVTEKKAN